MNKNQVQGIVTLPILIFCLIMMGLVVGSLPIFMNSEHFLNDEKNHLQAQFNAEAGIWMGLQEWNKDSKPISTSYALPSGQATVHIENVDTETIRIHSFGVTASGKDGIEADYRIPSKQFVHWHKVVQQ